MTHINPKVIEDLYAADLAYLQEFYNQINRHRGAQRAGVVPALRARVRGGAERRGGVLGYPLETLFEEVAFVAYHFHWPLERHPRARARRPAALGRTRSRRSTAA